MNKQETRELAELILDHLGDGREAAALAKIIDAKYLRIDRDELPDVRNATEGYFDVRVLGSVPYNANPATYRRIAMDYLAAAEHLERRGTEEAKREERRRDIYESLGGNEEDWAYVGKWSNMAAAVERILELTDGTQ